MAKKETRFGTFDELMAGVDPKLVEIATALRELLQEVDPNAVEVVRLGDNAATFGVGPKKMSEAYCYVMPQKKWVNLGFFKGGSLEDPHGLLEGTGKMMRHIKVHSLDEVKKTEIRTLIEAAFAERRAAVQ